MTDITMPRLSDSMEEGTILSWLKRDGERVERGEELVEIETDKATMTYESPEAGVVQIVAAVGATLAVGEPIARIGAAAPASVPAPEVSTPAPEAPTTTVPVSPEAAPAPPPSSGGASTNGGGTATAAPARVTPLARRVAREHGIDLAQVKGTGPRGRVTRGDVAAAGSLDLASPIPVGGGASAVTPAGPAASTPAGEDRPRPAGILPATGAKGDTTVVDLTRLQQVTARRMAEAKATVPHFQVEAEAQMGRVLALRAEIKALGGSAPSVNDFVIKAAAVALREHPKVNGSFEDGQYLLHGRVNVGVAVATDDGLLVPTVDDADARSLAAIATEVRRLAAKVREGAITPPELAGATFTVSNLGMFGMTSITPVINPPQAAILGVGKLRGVPAMIDGELVERQLMAMTVSADHRILNGADAARFLSRICELLEQPLLLAL